MAIVAYPLVGFGCCCLGLLSSPILTLYADSLLERLTLSSIRSRKQRHPGHHDKEISTSKLDKQSYQVPVEGYISSRLPEGLRF